MLYRLVSESVAAEQWAPHHAISELPLTVLPYKREDVHRDSTCVKCGHPMAEHGWIAETKPAPPETLPPVTVVDPATGLEPTAAVPGKSSFPKTYSKSGQPDRIVENASDETQALADGYYPNTTVLEEPPTAEAVAVPRSSFPKVYSKAGQPDRTINDGAEETQALADGFYPNPGVPPQSMGIIKHPVAPPAKPKVHATGMPVCPGNWVISKADGSVAVLSNKDFAASYTAVN